MSTEDKGVRIVLEWTQSLEEMMETGHLDPNDPAVPIMQKWLDLSQEIANDLAVLKVVDGSLEGGDLPPEAEACTRPLTDELKWLAETWRAYLGDPEVEMEVPVQVIGLSNVYLRV